MNPKSFRFERMSFVHADQIANIKKEGYRRGISWSFFPYSVDSAMHHLSVDVDVVAFSSVGVGLSAARSFLGSKLILYYYMPSYKSNFTEKPIC